MPSTRDAPVVEASRVKIPRDARLTKNPSLAAGTPKGPTLPGSSVASGSRPVNNGVGHSSRSGFAGICGKRKRETGFVVPGTNARVEFVYRLTNAGHRGH